MECEFEGEIWYWKGPAPFFFVTMPERESAELKELSSVLSYGWGVIPVRVKIGRTEWTTSLFPKDGRYLVPIKDRIRKAEKLNEGDVVRVLLAAERRS